MKQLFKKKNKNNEHNFNFTNNNQTLFVITKILNKKLIKYFINLF